MSDARSPVHFLSKVDIFTDSIVVEGLPARNRLGMFSFEVRIYFEIK